MLFSEKHRHTLVLVQDASAAHTVILICKGVVTLCVVNQQAAHLDLSSHCNTLLGADDEPKVHFTWAGNNMHPQTQHTAVAYKDGQDKQQHVLQH